MADRYDPKEISSLANSVRKMLSLDEPPEMSTAETVADIAAGFMPGVGTAQAARDFERARRSDDKLGMALAGVGAIPVVGGAVKPAKAAAKSLAEMVERYATKEAPKEQKMLQGVYRGYAGENVPAKTAFGTDTYFVSPQKRVADYYAQRRAAETGNAPHAEMVLVDPSTLRNQPYGLSIPIDKYNRDFLMTRARRVDPDEVKSRTQLYAEGGAVNDDAVRQWFAANPATSDRTIAAAMNKYGVTPQQVSNVTSVALPEVQQRYDAAINQPPDYTGLVTSAYRNILGRDPEKAGLDYWSGQLTSGALTPDQLNQNVVAAAQGTDAPNAQRYAERLAMTQAATNAVTQAYQNIVGRTPEAEGMQYWTNQLMSGSLAPDQLNASIAAAAQGADRANADRYAANLAAMQPPAQPSGSGGSSGGTRKTLDDLASAYSIANFVIPGFQAVPLIHYGLKALSLGNTIKSIGRRLGFEEGGLVEYDPDEIAQIAERATQGFAAGGLVNYDPNEIDTIVSRVKEEFHG